MSLEFEDLMDKVRSIVDAASMPTKPSSFGHNYTFPEDMTKESNEALGQLMSQLGSYRGYAARQLGVYEIKDKLLNKIFRMRMQEFYLAAGPKPKGMNATKYKEQAMLCPEAIELRKEITEASTLHGFYINLVSIYTGQLEVLSREISRRKQGEI